MAVYYATKAYVLSFSEALANETAGTGVTVTALCPGTTVTEFQKSAGVGSTRPFGGPLVMDAASAARAGYEGMLRGKTVVNLFFEDSTRTRISFEAAAKRLSADVINFAAKGSSVSKGESLQDTAQTLQAMGADAVVIRHGASGAPRTSISGSSRTPTVIALRRSSPRTGISLRSRTTFVAAERWFKRIGTSSPR